MTKLLLVVPALMLAGCASEADCDLNSELRSRAGEGATDCGHVAVGASTASVDACVIAAFNQRRAFYARYARQGIDSKLVSGIASDGSGNVTLLQWDSDPSGGSGAHPTIFGDTCVDPSVATAPAQNPFAFGPLACASMTSLGNACR